MEKLLQLKEKLFDAPLTDAFANDWYLMMWLKFHKMDVKKTEAAVRMSIAYRQKWGFGTGSKPDFPEPEPNEIPIFFKVGKDGLTPVIVFRVGSMHVRSLKKKYGKGNLTRMIDVIFYNGEKEFIERVNAKYEDSETKCKLDMRVLNIADYTGFSVIENAHPSAVDTLLQLTKNGVEWIFMFVANNVIVNASPISAVVIKAVKLFLPGEVVVFEEQDEGWKEVVSNYIEPDTVTALLLA